MCPKTEVMAIRFCYILKCLFGLELYKKSKYFVELVLLKVLNHLLGDVLCKHSTVVWENVMI